MVVGSLGTPEHRNTSSRSPRPWLAPGVIGGFLLACQSCYGGLALANSLIDNFGCRFRIRAPRCPADGSTGSRRQGLGTAHRPCGRPRFPPIQVNGSASAGLLLLQRPFRAILQPLPWPDGIVASPPASWRGSANGSRLPDAAEVWARTYQGNIPSPRTAAMEKAIWRRSSRDTAPDWPA